MKKKIIYTIIILLAIIASGIAGYTIGIKQAPKDQTSFYAKILEYYDNSLHIAGIPENDINHRGEFVLSLSGNGYTITDYLGNKVAPEALVEGASVRITYGGFVLETYPAQINTVYKIEILDE